MTGSLCLSGTPLRTLPSITTPCKPRDGDGDDGIGNIPFQTWSGLTLKTFIIKCMNTSSYVNSR